MEKKPKITIDHVKKVYRSYDGKETVALNGVDLTIYENEFICVVGPSGCGKTTLLNMIAGLETVTEGEIRLDDEIYLDNSATTEVCPEAIRKMVELLSANYGNPSSLHGMGKAF